MPIRYYAILRAMKKLPNKKIELIEAPCTICARVTDSEIVYPANFTLKDFNAAIFSARRLPDRIHYQMVRCKTCGLLRSSPRLNAGALQALYQESVVTYEGDMRALNTTYGNALSDSFRFAKRHERLMEIGCGDGFFLLEAKRRGVKEVWGVEPSDQARAIADITIRKNIKGGLYRPGLFKKDYLDIICYFQVIDHLPDPFASLKQSAAELREGGIALIISHNLGASTNKFFGRRSPIIDIEHTYLFDKKTITRICEQAGLRVRHFAPLKNAHTLRHWIELFPFPRTPKKILLAAVRFLKISELLIRLPAGNFVVVAQKINK